MIYVHVPFCKSFCIYCDFYSEIACDRDLTSYIDTLCKEAQEKKEQILSTKDNNTLYIGGGTPSVMPLPFFEKLLKNLPLTDFEEFTVELNPEDVTSKGIDYIKGLIDLGVSRFSMGVQSLDDKVLKWMNRRHNSKTAINAFEILRAAGADNISLDLIFGVASLKDASHENIVGIESHKALQESLRGIIGLNPEHISAYQLSIEDGSALGRMVEKGQYSSLSDEQCEAQYHLICSELAKAGYEHYEISNWARLGKRSKHNSAYWDRLPYVGLGPGAHSFLITEDVTQMRMWNPSDIKVWVEKYTNLKNKTYASKGKTSNPAKSAEHKSSKEETFYEVLNVEQIKEEQIMLGLRKKEGIILDGKHLYIPEDKWFIADSIIADLMLEIES